MQPKLVTDISNDIRKEDQVVEQTTSTLSAASVRIFDNPESSSHLSIKKILSLAGQSNYLIELKINDIKESWSSPDEITESQKRLYPTIWQIIDKIFNPDERVIELATAHLPKNNPQCEASLGKESMREAILFTVFRELYLDQFNEEDIRPLEAKDFIQFKMPAIC